jgi:hypothetical protein
MNDKNELNHKRIIKMKNVSLPNKKILSRKIWAGCFALSVLLGVQEETSAQQLALAFECTFPLSSTVSGGEFDGKNMRLSSSDTMKFTIVLKGSEAFLVGNNGIEQVQFVRHGTSAFTFIEKTRMGAVQILAIDSNLNAVHSRHTMMFTPYDLTKWTLMPSQYYGRCNLKQ